MTTEEPTAPKARRRWLQFSLRTLMVLVVLVSLPQGWFAARMQRAKRQREAVEAIWKLGGSSLYDYQGHWSPVLPQGPQPSRPKWLRKLLGDDFFTNVSSVGFCDGAVIDDDLGRILEGLTHLRVLSLVQTKVTDAGLTHLRQLPDLRHLELRRTDIITDVGPEHLRELTELRYLWLDGTKITDAGLEHLQELTQLRYLNLSGTQVTDVGLEHLRGLEQLRWLYLSNTQVTHAGVNELKKALPNVYVYR